MNKDLLLQLEHFACKIRIETIKQIKKRGFGHLPGSLSVVEALAILYGHKMKLDAKNPTWSDRDFMVMSKGHAGPSVYTCLALKGFFPLEELQSLNQPHTKLPSHCDRLLTPGVDMTAGSLGQGISAAAGLALAHKVDEKDNKVYCFIGDGESNEGQVWEALLFAAHQKFSNFVLFVDRNLKQLDGNTEDILALGDISEKIKSFGFFVQNVDGHSLEEILAALEKAEAHQEGPSCIVLHTLKGKGVKSLEDMELNHHIQFSEAQAEEALAPLLERYEELSKALEQQNLASLF